MSELDIHIGLALRYIRTRRREDPERLANILSVSLETYAAYENGLKAIPAATLIDLALHFRVSVKYFLDGYAVAEKSKTNRQN